MEAATTIFARSSSSGLLAALILLPLAGAAANEWEEMRQRGKYLVRAGGCMACHTDTENEGARLAGGGAVESPFGTFYGSNLTPDHDTGLGGWTVTDFKRAMRRGISPKGKFYYPAFPYPAFGGLTDGDLADMWEYLRQLRPVKRPNRPHDLDFPFGLPPAALGWRLMFFTPKPWAPDPERSAQWNRGAYLGRHLLHCGECHTPRNALGARAAGRDYSGHAGPADDGPTPNITPHETGIADWSAGDLAWLLETGLAPSGDSVQGSMAKLVELGSSRLLDEDLAAVAEYVLSLPPIDNRVRAAPAGAGGDDDYDYEFD